MDVDFRIKRSVEASSAAAAREAARAAAKERQTRKAPSITSEQAAELARLKVCLSNCTAIQRQYRMAKAL